MLVGLLQPRWIDEMAATGAGFLDVLEACVLEAGRYELLSGGQD